MVEKKIKKRGTIVGGKSGVLVLCDGTKNSQNFHPSLIEKVNENDQ